MEYATQLHRCVICNPPGERQVIGSGSVWHLLLAALLKQPRDIIGLHSRFWNVKELTSSRKTPSVTLRPPHLYTTFNVPQEEAVQSSRPGTT